MTDVFISYSRKDKAFVQTLHEALKAHDRNTWVDWEGIPLTADWWQEIERGIEGANTFVFVISPDSISSKVCRQEIDHAVKHNKRLVPIVHREGFELDKTIPSHEALNRHNWLFFRETDDFDAAFQGLVTAIDTDLEHVRAHTRLLERAIEWDTKARNPSLLLRGDDLEDAEQWLAQGASKEPRTTELQGDYISTSRKTETVRQKADRRKQQLFILGVGVFALLAAGAAVLAFQQQSEAKHQAKLAQASEGQAKQQTRLAEERLAETLAAKKTAEQRTTEAEAAKQKAEAARNAEAEQKLKAVSAQKLAEQRQVEAQEQRQIAERRQQETEIARMNVSIALGQAKASESRATIAKEEAEKQSKIAFARQLASQAQSKERIGNLPSFNQTDISGGVFSLRIGQAALPSKVSSLLQNGNPITVRFSPDRQYVAIVNLDYTSGLFNIFSGKRIDIPGRNEVPVIDVVFSPDGKTIATANQARTVSFWHFQQNQRLELLETLKGHTNYITATAFSPDGKTFATASQDNTAILWSFNGQQIQRLRHDGGINSIFFSASGRFLVTASNDCTARVWNIDGTEVMRLPHNGPVRLAVFGDDESFVATVSENTIVKFFPFKTNVSATSVSKNRPSCASKE